MSPAGGDSASEQAHDGHEPLVDRIGRKGEALERQGAEQSQGPRGRAAQPPRPAAPCDPLFPMTVSDAAKAVTLKGESLGDDIDTLNELRWNWQPLLRAVAPHPPLLERVRLIGSAGEKGSFVQLERCAAILQHYLPRVNIEPAAKEVSFDDLDALVGAMRAAIREEEMHGMKPHQVLIDVTGGKKMTSVAGAVATLNGYVKVQYVDMETPFKVSVYDVVFDSEVSLEE